MGQKVHPYGLRLGFTRVPLYSLVFHCRALGGELKAHPLETAGVGWFAEDALPWPLAGAERWGPPAFRALRGASHRQGSVDSPFARVLNLGRVRVVVS